MLVNFLNNAEVDKTVIIRAVCDKATAVLSLPDSIDVEFRRFSDGTWGGTHLDWKIKNRIVINSELTVNEIPIVLVHELIHISQMRAGMLVVDRGGKVYWQGRQYQVNGLSYAEYQRLPWELDVAHRLKKILELIITT